LSPCMFGMISMKMISSTWTTSTSGVTLMVGLGPLPGLPVSTAMPMRALQVVDQLAGGVLHLHVEAVDAARQVVEEEHRGDCDDEADGGDDQGLGDAGGHGRDAAAAGAGDALEGDDDADDGAEQADEGGGRADRG